MNRKSFLKTTLGSVAALSIPAAAQALNTQQVTPVTTGGVKSSFAFGGQFNLGEVTLYQHSPEIGMSGFFRSIACDVWGKDKGQAILFNPIFSLDDIVLGIRINNRKERSILIIFNEIKSYEEIVELKEVALKYPMVSVICSEGLTKNGCSLVNTRHYADNVINYDYLRDGNGRVIHKSKLMKSRNNIVGQISWTRSENY